MPKVINLKTSLAHTLDDLRSQIESREIANPVLLFTMFDEDGDECVGYWALQDEIETPMVVFMCQAVCQRMLE